MPGIIAFRRRWSVGSDDLVVPGLFLFFIHLIWLVVISVILAMVEFNKQIECISLLWQQMIGYLIVILVSLLLELIISLTALRGSILDTEQRKSIPSLIYIRLVVLCFEMVWLVIGGMWIAHYYRDCPLSPAKDALVGLVICSWLVILSFFITLWCTFDPAGRSWVKMMNYQRSMKASESRFQYRRSGSCMRTWRQRKVLRAYQNSWDQRCRLLFCCMRHSDRSQNSFGDIARLLSDFFRDIDVVPSDVVAGLILLRKYQKIEREAIVKQRLNDTYEYLSGVAVTSGTQFLPLNDPVYYGFFQDVIHYMTFALGAYGWPMYFMNNPSATVCRLCVNLRCSCFPCFRSTGKNAATIIKDNCCQCNYAALKEQVEAKDVEVVYATFHVDVGITPFFVAVDYSRKKVIVSIRGTLSMQDVITDLNAEGEPIPINPPKEDWLGHTGMIQVAAHIQKKLVEESILQQAFNFNLERGTRDFKLVIVGHSLGAGAAAILSILLRETYPDVICFSYSPPGGTLSLPAAEYTKSFITSVVVGKDVVPRIGLHQMESLRADLMHAIKRSKDPKWKTISCSVVCCSCAGLPTSARQLELDDSMQMEYKRDKSKAREFVYHSQSGNVALTSHQPLYPPGRIIHVVRHHTTRQEQRYESKWRQIIRKRKPVYQALWANNTDFDEVLISPVMIQDHMPENVLAALNKVITTVGPRKPQRTAAFSNGAAESESQQGDSENCRLIYNFPSHSPKAQTPSHRLQLETSFASLISANEKSNCKISLQSFCSHGSSNAFAKNGSCTFGQTGIGRESRGTFSKNPVPWEYRSVVDEGRGRDKSANDRYEPMHDDWLGLAPLATPESLSEVSSISSRASSMIIHNDQTASTVLRDRWTSGLSFKRKYTNGCRTVRQCESEERIMKNPFRLKNVDNSDSSDSYLDSPPVYRNSSNPKCIRSIDSRKSSSGESSFLNYGIDSPEREYRMRNDQRSPRAIRRTPKIPKDLSTAYEDSYSNRKFEEMMKISLERCESASNETDSLSNSARGQEIDKSTTDLYVTPISSCGDSVRFRFDEFFSPEKVLENFENSNGKREHRKIPTENHSENVFEIEEDINYHKPTIVILPTDENFSGIVSGRKIADFRLPYLETDFSLSDSDLTFRETEKSKRQKRKIDFDVERDKLVESENGSAIDFSFSNFRCEDEGDTVEELQRSRENRSKGETIRGEEEEDEEAKRRSGKKAGGKNCCGSTSTEILPLLSNLTRDRFDRKKKYSFSFLTISKGESSV